MNNLFAIVALVLVFTRECVSVCPLTVCLAIEYPPSCRVTVFGVQDGEVCQLCDDCIEKNSKKDKDGCPLRKCNRMHIPPACRMRKYFTFNNNICEDCPMNTCQY